MKRVKTALFLVAVVVFLSIASLLFQHHVTNTVIAECNELTALYESGKTDECYQASAAFLEKLEKEIRWFPFFLKHERIDSLFQQAASLPYLVRDEDSADFFSTVASIRMQLDILMDNEWPTPENIL